MTKESAAIKAALEHVAPAGARTPLESFLAGQLSAETTLMELVCETEDAAALQDILATTEASLCALEHDGTVPALVPALSERVAKLRRTLGEHAAGCERIARMLREGPDSSAPARSVAEGLQFVEQLFDWSVAQNEETSVALYSLGDPRVLERATKELVTAFEAWQLIRKHSVILQIGCGIGRLEAALAPRVADAYGIDVSGEMIVRARIKCADLPNVHLQKSAGRDLSMFPGALFDLVYAVDTFPYLVQAGAALVETHFAEAQRVLKPAGSLAILNYSYRADHDADLQDIRALSSQYGFDLVRENAAPFKLWNGSAFILRKIRLSV